MKKQLLLTLFLLCGISSSFAQVLHTANTSVNLRLSATHTNGTQLKHIGIGLLCFGLVDIVGGAAMVSSADGVVSYSSSTSSNGTTQTQGSLTGAMGLLGIVGGSVASIGGGLLMYVGQHKINQSKNVSFHLSPASGSVVFSF